MSQITASVTRANAMEENTKGSALLNILFVGYFIIEGLVALAYKQLFIFGKYIGKNYELDFPSNVLIATASFIVASLGVIPHLTDKDTFIRAGQVLLTVAFVLFTTGFFI